MKKFRQKAYVDPSIASKNKPKYGPLDMGLNTVFAIQGHKQNKNAIEQGEELLKNNAKDFEEQMKLREQEHQQTMDQLSQQKMFFDPFIVGMVASTAVSGVQGKKANKIAEEQGEAQMKQAEQFQKQQMKQDEEFQKEQMKFQKQQLKTQEMIARKQIRANQGVTGPISMSYSEIGTCKMSGELQKEFGAGSTITKGIKTVADRMASSGAWKKISGSNIGKNTRGLIQDVGQVASTNGWGKKAAEWTAMGATMTGASYLVDKAITTDAKKSGIAIDNSNQEKPELTKGQKIKKGAAIGAGTLATAGTALVLARKGKLNAKTFKKVGGDLKTGFKSQFVGVPGSKEQIANAEKKLDLLKKTGASQKAISAAEGELSQLKKTGVNKIGIAVTAGIPAISAVSYLGQKKQLKDQVQQTQNASGGETRTYSIPLTAIKPVASRAGTAIKSGAKYVGKKVSNAGGAVIDLLSFSAGKTEQEMLGKQLQNLQKPSGSKYTAKLSNFLADPKKARVIKTVGGIAVGSTAMTLPFTASDKIVRKAVGAVDKNAFAYENSQNQQVQ